MDQDKLIDAVTKTIMDRLANHAAGPANVVIFGNVPGGIVAPGLATRRGVGPADVEGSDVIVLTIDAFRALHGATAMGMTTKASPASCVECGDVDLTGKKLISERELKATCPAGGCQVRVSPQAVVTALAKDYAASHKITIVKG